MEVEEGRKLGVFARGFLDYTHSHTTTTVSLQLTSLAGEREGGRKGGK